MSYLNAYFYNKNSPFSFFYCPLYINMPGPSFYIPIYINTLYKIEFNKFSVKSLINAALSLFVQPRDLFFKYPVHNNIFPSLIQYLVAAGEKERSCFKQGGGP
jgi:hypothetical protein